MKNHIRAVVIACLLSVQQSHAELPSSGSATANRIGCLVRSFEVLELHVFVEGQHRAVFLEDPAGKVKDLIDSASGPGAYYIRRPVLVSGKVFRSDRGFGHLNRYERKIVIREISLSNDSQVCDAVFSKPN